MKSIILKSLYLLTIFTSVIVASCADDFPYHTGIIPEGEGNLSATVTFTPVTANNLGSTRTNGDAINNIETLCVLVYSTDGKLIKKYNQSELVDYNDKVPYNVDTEKDYLEGGDNPHTDETTTARATFTLPGLPFGQYKIYAVANMGNLDEDKYADAILKEEDLKRIQLTWDPKNIKENNQMFGFFTSDQEMGNKGFNAPVFIFRDSQQKIHAWLKRAASKVTVAFDPSGLNQGVKIYIRNVTIRDIPKTCWLGAENTPESVEELDNHVKTPYLVPDYHNTTEVVDNSRFEYNSDGVITNDTEHTGDAKTDGFRLDNSIRSAVPEGAHAPNAPSLFFYENNQNSYLKKKDPDYNGKPVYDKQQKPSNDESGDGVGTPIRDDKVVDKETGEVLKSDTDLKDRVPFGTYIEVEAYYISENPAKVGEGTIKYRFMLGKDTRFDYDAQRNYHFKVTLGFKGWANDPDWHIDYELPEPGIEVPPTFRVSYLYQQMSQLPIRILGDIEYLTAEIIENNWAPYDPNSRTNDPFRGYMVPSSSISAPAPSTDRPDLYNFQWNRQAYTNDFYWHNYNFEGYPDKNQPRVEFGFLALHMPNRNTTAVDEEYSEAASQKLINYYNDHEEGIRRFFAINGDLDLNEGEDDHMSTSQDKNPSAQGDDKYSVIPVLNDAGDALPNQKTLLLPLWTRTKTLIAESGFSGNNPYEAFERKAVLQIRAKFKGYPDTFKKEVEVLQVKRLVNPKGVWRDAGRTETFNVTLLEAINSNAMSDFQPFTSDGEWTAYIDGSTNQNSGFSLRPNGETNGYMKDGVIHGYTGSTINFAIDFGTPVSADQSECAIVKVLYHGNQCLHKILIRKGYAAPIRMGGKLWSSYSLYQANPTGGVDGYSDTYDAILTKNPLMLGSMFRRGIQSTGIRVASNQDIGFLVPPNGAAFKVASTRYTTRTWSQIGYRNDAGIDANKDKSLGTFHAEGRTYRVPTYEDWEKLTQDAEFGFGVVYGSAATAPALTAEDAYGLIDPDNTGEFTDPRGMRGIIAYNKETGNQIFFPVGKFGTGHRTMFNIPNNTYQGVLRYSDVYNPLTIDSYEKNLYRPIPYNLPIASGNIYWIDVYKPNVRVVSPGGNDYNQGCLGWDLNYFNFDFNPYTANNYRDACPIKFVIEE